MTFAQFLSILRGRWWLAVSVLVAITVLTLIVSLILPKQYVATASVVIDVKPDPVSAMMYQGMASPAYMATQVDVIQSDRVALRVVRNLNLTNNPQIQTQWRDATDGEGAIEPWLAAQLQKNMDVKPSRESNVITLAYKAPDPRFAAGLANAYMQAYIDTSLELRTDPAKQYSAYFDARAKQAREAVEKAQAKLSSFQREKGIVATDERLDIENARLAELSTQLVMIQGAAAESSSRQGAANGSSSGNIQEVLTNPVISSLKADLSRQEAKLRELSSRYGDAHPQVVELKANINELRGSIATETRRVTSGVGVSNSINRSRESQIRAELDAQRDKILKMKQARDEGSVLYREVEIAQKSYDLVMGRLDQSSLESQTTQSNVNLLTPASVPTQASTPRVFQNTVLALFLGTLLGVGTVLVLELMDRRVRGVEGINEMLGLPVIGILPGTNSKRRPGSKHALLAQQRMVGRLAGPTPKGT